MFEATSEKLLHDNPLYQNLATHVRGSLELIRVRFDALESQAQQQLHTLPRQLQGALKRTIAQVRAALDVPSRAKIAELTERLDALQRQLDALETAAAQNAASQARQSKPQESKSPNQKTTAETGRGTTKQAPAADQPVVFKKPASVTVARSNASQPTATAKGNGRTTRKTGGKSNGSSNGITNSVSTGKRKSRIKKK